MKRFGFIISALCGLLLLFVSTGFPDWGDPAAPASLHLSPEFIRRSIPDTAVPNIVTAVLADYRGYDTMFETVVVFTAGAACLFLLGSLRRKKEEMAYFRHMRTGIVLRFRGKDCRLPTGSDCFEQIDPSWTPHDFIVSSLSRLIIPFILLFGLYVLAHGHHSPGGGFQGGVITAGAALLLSLSHNLRVMLARIHHRYLGILSAAGVLIYVGVGLLCLLFGGNFLDYSVLAGLLGTDPAAARSLGILFVEIGVAVAVAATMVVIYVNVSSAGNYDEGL